MGNTGLPERHLRNAEESGARTASRRSGTGPAAPTRRSTRRPASRSWRRRSGNASGLTWWIRAHRQQPAVQVAPAGARRARRPGRPNPPPAAPTAGFAQPEQPPSPRSAVGVDGPGRASGLDRSLCGAHHPADLVQAGGGAAVGVWPVRASRRGVGAQHAVADHPRHLRAQHEPTSDTLSPATPSACQRQITARTSLAASAIR